MIGVVGVIDETGEVVDVLEVLMRRGDGGIGGGCCEERVGRREVEGDGLVDVDLG